MNWQPLSTFPKTGKFVVASRGFTKDDGSWEWTAQIGWRDASGAVFVPIDNGYPAFWATLPDKDLIAK